MAFFCENCGSKLVAGSVFCENCGCSVAELSDNSSASEVSKVEDVAAHYSVFSEKDWKSKWRQIVSEKRSRKIGIVLTNTEKCGAFREDFFFVLNDYIAHSLENDVGYYVLDMADQNVKHRMFGGALSDVDFVVAVLKEIYGVGAPEYLMIIGDRTVIGSSKWKNALYDPNGYGDSDKFVDSDVAYSTLDVKSPFEGGSMRTRLAVGRIPAMAESGFDEACRYMMNAIQYGASAPQAQSLALSAREWKLVSQCNFGHLSPDFYTCPGSSFVRGSNLSIIPNNGYHNLLCFNLHGGPTHDYWVSGDGSAAFSPDCLPTNDDVGYMLGTEACYGAKPMIRAGSDAQSVLVTAIKNRCLAYVGSTQIAYGIPDDAYERGYQPFAADVLIGEFSKQVAQGNPAGEAYVLALDALVYNENNQGGDAECIKTFCSFGLYGDPAVRLCGGNGKAAQAKSFAKSDFGLHLCLPDVRKAVHLSLTKVSAQIAKVVDDYVCSCQSHFEKVEPRYYSVSGYEGYKASYAKSDDNGVRILNVYLSKSGSIDRVYISK